jgi:hypothetical protein
MQINDIVDTTHPKWDEIKKDFKDKMSFPADNVGWPQFVKFFDEDLLTDFLDIIKLPPNKFESEIVLDILTCVNNYIYVPYHGYIQCKDSDQTKKLLSQLVDIWNFDLAKNIYVSMCIQHHKFNNIDQRTDLIKFFLEQGATFNIDTIKLALNYEEKILELMISSGVDPDEIARHVVNKIMSDNSNISNKLKFLAKKTDIVGHLDQALR